MSAPSRALAKARRTFGRALARVKALGQGGIGRGPGRGIPVDVLFFPGGVELHLVAVEDEPKPRALVVCLGASTHLEPGALEALRRRWTNVRVFQLRTGDDLNNMADLARVALAGRRADALLVGRSVSGGPSSAEQSLLEAVNRAQLEPLPGPAVIIPIDQVGQLEDAQRHRTRLRGLGIEVHCVSLGPFSDAPTSVDGPAAMRVECAMNALAVVYPYGPATSALIETARELDVPIFELEADVPVDRTDSAAAVPVDGPFPSPPIELGPGGVAWSQVTGACGPRWAALNEADSRRTQQSAALVRDGALTDFANRHAGDRCVIIGNGPSLNKLDLSAIADEVTFGVNSIFLGADTMGFVPTYYMVEDNLVMKENAEAVLACDAGHKFFPARYVTYFDKPADNVTFFTMDSEFYEKSSPAFGVPRFSEDFGLRGVCGQSVTILNLQLAYYMGFTEVILIGMDFSYVIPDSAIREGSLITSTEDDPNHFHPGYFGPGKTWKDPKLDRVLSSYQLAKRMYEADGRRIVNATAGGALELFPRVSYDELFG